VAVLADIHGNTWALEAVLAHARQAGATQMITLGDMAYGPLDPRGTVERLRLLELPAIHIRGNEDRALWDETEPREAHHSLTYTLGQLGDHHVRWLQELPAEGIAHGMRLCHGTPESDTEYLLETVTPQGLRPSTLEHLLRRLDGMPERVVLCGHSHLPGCVRTAAGTLIVNPGSVGLQAFTDNTPHFHVAQARSPHARYALMEPIEDDWSVTHVALPYDWEAAARTADLNGRPDWARALRSGWI
jgi:putative phosphoesterase